MKHTVERGPMHVDVDENGKDDSYVAIFSIRPPVTSFGLVSGDLEPGIALEHMYSDKESTFLVGEVDASCGNRKSALERLEELEGDMRDYFSGNTLAMAQVFLGDGAIRLSVGEEDKLRAVLEG